MISERTTVYSNRESDGLLNQMAELLLQMAEVERRVEGTRQLLAENTNYDPNSAFLALDKSGTNMIT